VTVAGKPAVNVAITIVETDLKPDAAGGLAGRVPFSAKARTEGDGRYLVTGLAEGRYVISAALKAFFVADISADHSLSRTVTLDEGEARGKVDFALIRGGVITGKVTDGEGRPFIAKHVQLHPVDKQELNTGVTVVVGEGTLNKFLDSFYQDSSLYEMSETDDRGLYRIYGLPPGRYIICAYGEEGGDPLHGGGGKFPLTCHPDATDEKQARIIEVKADSEIADVDIRFGSARKTYEALGRVVDRETGKPVPGVSLSCGAKPEEDGSGSGYWTTVIVDWQGNFRLVGLTPGRYQIRVMDELGEMGYTADIAEFEVSNDNVSGVEVKAFLGATISGVVVIEGGDPGAKEQLQGMTISSSVLPSNNATDDTNIPPYVAPAGVNADGSFTIRGLQAGSVGFSLTNVSAAIRIKRVERDGVEIKDPIEVRLGEKITGIRIAVSQPNGRIRGLVQDVGGALPDGWRLLALAMRPVSADESRAGARGVAPIDRMGGSAIVDEKGRFVIEAVPAGEYDLSVNPIRFFGEGRWSLVNSPGTNQRVTVRENDETSVTIIFDPNRKN
jgi:hypothetical protein